MKANKIAFKLACWSLIIGGIIHTAAEIFSPTNPEMLTRIETMKSFTFQLLGTESSIYSFYLGFSFMMGLLLFSFGMVNFLMLKNSKDEPIPSNILILNSAVTLIGTVLSIQFFFMVPILLIGVAFLGFTFSLIKTKAHAN
ncbi:hypothetical protein DNU06_08045 [Putridiphycobacter roseus]|uniref:DUF4064 domain-containing protein n=1 Tax=Putridiphycobacter roseus TaxID=2219161 RepID=A0A2W1NCV0_9FLAO|nr:hypothetical protein [Putridiphycobacter roseus]PZE17215.1 hypothetical protein DNU06_08045 [Putridiphycobacter roseus]